MIPGSLSYANHNLHSQSHHLNYGKEMEIEHVPWHKGINCGGNLTTCGTETRHLAGIVRICLIDSRGQTRECNGT